MVIGTVADESLHAALHIVASATATLCGARPHHVRPGGTIADVTCGACEDIHWSNEFARHEAAQERAVYAAKAEREHRIFQDIYG